MTYTKTILCLACSRRKGRCIAGKEVLEDDRYCIAGKEVLKGGKFGSWVRPIFSEEIHSLKHSAICYDNGELPKLLDYMEIPFIKRLPGGDKTGHQVENELIDRSKQWSRRGAADWQTTEKQCDDPDLLWRETRKVPELTAKNLKSSLMLIKPESPIKINIELRKWKPEENFRKRADFEYRGMHYYNFPVTDINYDVYRFSNYPEVVKIMDKYCLPVTPKGYVEKTKNGSHRVRFLFAKQFDKKRFEQLGSDEKSKLILQKENFELSERKTDAPGLLLKPDITLITPITNALLCISLGELYSKPEMKDRYAYKLVAGIITPNMS